MKKLWVDHGTKLIGLVQIAAAALVADPTTLGLLQSVVGMRNAGVVWLLLTGAATVARGVANSTKERKSE